MLSQAVHLDGFTWFDKTTATVLSLHGLSMRRTLELAPAHVLAEPDAAAAQKRHAARALGGRADDEARAALLGGLSDPRFEVRFECGRALARLRDETALAAQRSHILRLALAEVSVSRAIWESQKLYDDNPSLSIFDSPALRERANQSLEHVFTLLSLVLPRRPLIIAYHALSSDARARGTALEYLDSVLPPEIREAWDFLEVPEQGAHRSPRRSREEVLADLERLSETLKGDAFRGR